MAGELMDKENIRVRNMDENDIPAVVALDLKVTGVQDPVSESGVIESYVSGGLGLSCVAEAEGKIIGYILGRLAYTPAPDIESAWVQLLGVDTAYRRRGIGKQLMEVFRRRCLERGAKVIHASVPTQNTDVQDFLKECGFGMAEWAHYTMTV